MPDSNQRIKELEEELRTMQYNKRTQHHAGRLKAQIAKLRESAENSGGGASGGGYAVKRSGDGTVILLGFPSAGKSTLLNVLTNQESETGAYAFTTLTVVPGLLEYNHAQIQVLDVPGIVSGAAAGRGRGKEVLATMRSADLCIILLDATRPEELDVIRKEIYDAGIRLDQEKPDVKIKKKPKDGLSIGRTVRTPELDDKTVTDILSTFRIFNADVVIRSPITEDQFIDCIQDNKKYMDSVLIINKADLITEEQRRELDKLNPDLYISAALKQGIPDLKDLLFDSLKFIRIFTKEPGKEADMTEPLIMRSGSTVRDVANKLHRDFEKQFKFSRITGPSAKFDRQKQGLDHVVLDGDIVELHTR